MRIRPILFGLLVVAIFLAPVVVAQATGTWATTGRPAAGNGAESGDAEGGSGQGGGGGEPGAGEGQGGGEGPGAGGGQGPGTGEIAPGDARGWMTLAQVAEANGLDVAEILAAFDLPASTDPATELRDLEAETFSVAALRDWLAGRTSP
jgi:hypothetical protein